MSTKKTKCLWSKLTFIDICISPSPFGLHCLTIQVFCTINENLTKMKLTSSSSNIVRKCQMGAKKTYNATIRTTKCLPSTTEGGRKVRKPTTNSKCHGLDDRDSLCEYYKYPPLKTTKCLMARRSLNHKPPTTTLLASSLSILCFSLRTLAFPFLSSSLSLSK